MEETMIAKLIADYGIQTVMLMWFMFRTEKVINRNSLAMERCNKR